MPPFRSQSGESTRELDALLARARREFLDWEDRFRGKHGRTPTAAEVAREERRRRRALERELRREWMRERRWLPGALLGGSVFIGGFSFGNDGGHLHLGFFAFGISLGALSAARAYWIGRREAARLAEELSLRGVAREAVDPGRERIHSLCRTLLRELEAAPPTLREALGDPSRTVIRIEQSALALLERERSLEATLHPAEDARLLSERDHLRGRVEAQPDPVTRERLADALASLEQQRAQREGLRTAAARINAERVRLERALEALRTQVTRVQSADAASVRLAGSGLAEALSELRAELGALAEALDAGQERP